MEDKVGQNLKKKKLHMNIAMISGTDLTLDKVTVHNNRPDRKNLEYLNVLYATADNHELPCSVHLLLLDLDSWTE